MSAALPLKSPDHIPECPEPPEAKLDLDHLFAPTVQFQSIENSNETFIPS